MLPEPVEGSLKMCENPVPEPVEGQTEEIDLQSRFNTTDGVTQSHPVRNRLKVIYDIEFQTIVVNIKIYPIVSIAVV